MAHRNIPEEDLGELVERVREATGALMQGDVRRYLALVNHAPDFTSCPRPADRRDRDSTPPPRASRLWKKPPLAEETGNSSSCSRSRRATSQSSWEWNGSTALWAGGLPDQDWPLRVTLVFRRESSDWRLVHRHADALVHPIGMEQLSLLARGSLGAS